MANSIIMTILNNKVVLDKICWCCEGGKVDPNKPEYTNAASFFTDGVCNICEGTGYELTEAGEAIIQLVNRHKGGA